ncbi:LADA_0G07140g1_1 [Lachancea dasiensis]|uniref:LADA_0G07140g1_1 n=1 Tax=Lachancea dasiensis TaxID=1072105 RepID=A0A1G4JTM3_9SACH|nr:LADA_0G07140g1_1 [Lachancea dasiensis]
MTLVLDMNSTAGRSGSEELLIRRKSTIAKILRSFSSSSSSSSPIQRRGKPTISSPTAAFQSPSGCLNTKRSQVFFDVCQDFLPHESDNFGFPGTRSADGSVEPRFAQQGLGNQNQLLNVHRGEIVRLVENMPNNLVLVRLEYRLGQGLVPARCLTLNNTLTPFSQTLTLANQFLTPPKSNDALSSSLDLDQQHLKCQDVSAESQDNRRALLPRPSFSLVDPISIDGSLAIASCQVKAIHITENRVWYRIDCVMKSGHHRALSRFYQDFYSLHLLLRDQLIVSGHQNVQDLLPALPSPCTAVSSTQIENRLHDFNTYLRDIIASPSISQEIKRASIEEDWLAPRPGDLVKTPRELIYRVKRESSQHSKACQWEPVTDFSSSLTPSAPGDIWSTKHKATIRQRRVTSLSEITLKVDTVDTSIHTPASNSAPATPISQARPFDSYDNPTPSSQGQRHIKVKVLYQEECFATRCSLSDLESYQQLHQLCHSKVKDYLPDVDIPLRITSMNDKKDPVLLNGETFSRFIAALNGTKFAAHNITHHQLKKLVVRVSA